MPRRRSSRNSSSIAGSRWRHLTNVRCGHRAIWPSSHHGKRTTEFLPVGRGLFVSGWGKILQMNLSVTRFVLVSVIALGIGLVAASSAANAQFVCGGGGTGAEPQAGGGSSGNAGSVACGLGVTAPSSNSVALGIALPFSSVTASGYESLAMGTGDIVGTIASGTRSVAIGSDTRALATGAVAIGGSATAGGGGGVAIGQRASAGTGLLSVAVGDLAFINPLNNNSTAVGGGSFINIGANTTVLGANAGTGFSASSSNSVAVGESALVSADNATAVGQGSHATALGATALGQASVAAFSNSAAIGSGVTTTRANQVAVGTATNTYTLAGASHRPRALRPKPGRPRS